MIDLHDAFLLTDDNEDLRRSWDGGIHFRPFDSSISLERVPVVLHFHGAYGFSDCEEVMRSVCNEAGYAFIAPNSFSRKYRRSNCIEGTTESGMFPPADLYRRAELIYAFEQVKNLGWADSDRVVLSGFSEGGEAVAVWGHLVPCRAAIISAWSCSAPPEWDWAHGLRLPNDVPILQVVSELDPWFDKPGWRPHYTTNRQSARQFFLPGSDLHEVYRLEMIQEEYRRFLIDLS
ncbi:dienelactone hydrolase family protein [Rhizobium pusense]|uniref:dienelactone hydrolase family protein n=1 Tax=Agrobacterium pusense TaxID=648995 RepID=UPI00244D6E45|nr:dienelactone hydrolase family protein [Agrobacterium pusense]MDH1270470.1 dienelactone hydrolase family protein [Agrobacterium pusense]